MDTLLVNGVEYFEARRIIDHLDSALVGENLLFFLVEWRNPHPPTWEPLTHLIPHAWPLLSGYLIKLMDRDLTLREPNLTSPLILLSRIVNGICESTWTKSYVRSIALSTSLQLFASVSKNGLQLDTHSLAASSWERTPPKMTMRSYTPTSHSSSILLCQGETLPTNSPSTSISKAPVPDSPAVTTYLPATPSLPSKGGSRTIPRSKRRLELPTLHSSSATHQSSTPISSLKRGNHRK